VKELGTGAGKSSIVSFRAGTQVGQKRKADAEDRVEAGGAGKDKKPTRRSKKTKR
jgi:N-acetyltransferase 10